MSERSRIEKAGGIVRMNRVDGDLAVSRAFGDATFKMSSNVGPREQKVICVPDITTMEVRAGDVLALCCDGVFEDNAMTSLSVSEAAWDFAQHGTAATTAMTAAAAAAFEARAAPLDHDLGVFGARVCDYAIARGSKDNISCMIVTVGGAIPGANHAAATTDAAESGATKPSVPTNPLEAYGEHSYVPSSIALFRRARNAQLAFERMAERAGVGLPAALRMRYELLAHRRNLAPPQFSALQAMAFDNADEADVAAELEFFGTGPTPGSEGDAWFERLLLQEEGKN
jgi:protein phosphatase